MRTKLFIHIGTHKTGSTTIQNALLKNYRSLRKENIIYLPDRKLFKQLMTLKHIDEKIIDDIRAKLKIILRCYKIKDTTRFVLSQEGLSGDPGFGNDLSFAGYKNAEIIAESLSRITENLDVEIIIYIRRQDTFIESLYTQRIHEGGYDSFNDFLTRLPEDAFNWEFLLNSYSKHFGKENINLRIYDKLYLPSKDSLLKDFSEVINSKSLLKRSMPSMNRGFSREALEIARITNRNLSYPETQILFDIFQMVSSKMAFENYSYWNFNERKEFMAKYEQSNKNIVNTYLDIKSKPLFSDIKPESEENKYRGLDLEKILPIIMKSIIYTNLGKINAKSVNFKTILRKLISNLFLRNNLKLKTYIYHKLLRYKFTYHIIQLF